MRDIQNEIYEKNSIDAAQYDFDNSLKIQKVYEMIPLKQGMEKNLLKLYYYDNRKKGEVDFLVDDYANLEVLPIEIKSVKEIDWN